MPDALFLDRPKEPLDHAVLFWSIGSDKLLGEVVGLHGIGKGFAAKDQSIITSQDNRAIESVQLSVSVDQPFL